MKKFILNIVLLVLVITLSGCVSSYPQRGGYPSNGGGITCRPSTPPPCGYGNRYPQQRQHPGYYTGTNRPRYQVQYKDMVPYGYRRY